MFKIYKITLAARQNVTCRKTLLLQEFAFWNAERKIVKSFTDERTIIVIAFIFQILTHPYASILTKVVKLVLDPSFKCIHVLLIYSNCLLNCDEKHYIHFKKVLFSLQSLFNLYCTIRATLYKATTQEVHLFSLKIADNFFAW